MDRHLPPGLSDAQRCALLEFYAGHVSAGQLTERLGIEASGRAQLDSAPELHRSRFATAAPLGRGVSDPPDKRGLLRWPEFMRTSTRRPHDPAVGGTGA